MFKKTLLSVAIATVLAGSAQAATIYDKDGNSFAVGGRIQANLNSVAFSESDKVDIEGYGRFNLDGKSKISDDLTAVAFAEWDIATESSQDGTFNTRFAYVGVESGTFGSLRAGRDYTSMYNVVGATDMFIDIGSDATTFWSLGGRQEGQAIYKYTADNFYFGGSYQTSSLDGVKGGFALSTGVNFDLCMPFAFNVGYDNYEFAETSDFDSLYSVATSLSLGTFGEGLYTAAMYQFTEAELKTAVADETASAPYGHGHSVEVVAGYGFENGLGLLAGYSSLRSDGRSAVSNVNLEVSYQVTSNFIVYSEAVIAASPVELEDSYDRDHNKFTVRAQYNF